MLKELFKREKNKTEETNDVAVCNCQDSLEQCDLVKLLREKQNEKKIIDNEIEAYERSEVSIMQYVRRFLMALEDTGFMMNGDIEFMTVENQFRINGYAAAHRIEKALDRFSQYEVKMLGDELYALKTKITVIKERKAALKVIEKDINEIKAKLGIM